MRFTAVIRQAGLTMKIQMYLTPAESMTLRRTKRAKSAISAAQCIHCATNLLLGGALNEAPGHFGGGRVVRVHAAIALLFLRGLEYVQMLARFCNN